MALKFVYSDTERILRSVGDPPNGIVGYASLPDGGGTVVVSPKAKPGATYQGDHFAMAAEHAESQIDDDEAVEACADGMAAMCLWQTTAVLLVDYASHELPPGNIAPFRSTLDAAEELLYKLQARFAHD